MHETSEFHAAAAVEGHALERDSDLEHSVWLIEREVLRTQAWMSWASALVVGLTFLNTAALLESFFPDIQFPWLGRANEVYFQVGASIIGLLWFLYGVYQYGRVRKATQHILLGKKLRLAFDPKDAPSEIRK